MPTAAEPSEPRSIRRAYNEFIARREVTWELGIAVLAIVFVIVGFAIDAADDATRPALEAADTALTIVFVAEFGSRFLASFDRRAHLRATGST